MLPNFESTENLEDCPSPNRCLPPTLVRQGSLKRIFGPLQTTSMRLCVLNTVMSIIMQNFLTFPLFFRTYGIVLGAVVLLFANTLNWTACGLILRASEFTQHNSFEKILEALFGRRATRVLSVSFFLDYFSNYICLLVQAWSCFTFVLNFFGLLDSSTLIPGNTLEFHEYHPEVFAWRFVFVAACFLFFTPIFMHRSYETVRCITIYTTVFWVAFTAFLMVDLTQFRSFYSRTGRLSLSLVSPPSADQIRLFYLLVSSLYIQTSLMTMKGEIANPNLRRMLKASRISYISVLAIAMFLGLYFYCCLGDLFTADVFMTRKSFPGKTGEAAYVLMIVLLILVNLAYIKFYHNNMHGFLVTYLPSRRLSEAVFVLPWVGSLIFVLFYPKVINFYAYCAATVFLLNGYILPLLMKRVIDRLQARHWAHVLLCDALIAALVIGAGFSLWATIQAE